jgi:hypothetical protein
MPVPRVWTFPAAPDTDRNVSATLTTRDYHETLNTYFEITRWRMRRTVLTPEFKPIFA